MVIAARKFEFLRGHEDHLHKNKEDCLEARKNLLINLLGFKDTGVSVGGDLQFLYQFSSKWSQVEIYLSTKDPGIVTELVMYDQTNRIEVRFPIRSIESLIYLFLQVCGDIYHWDFEKLELFEEDEYWVNDFKSTFDFMDIPTTDFIKYIMNGGLIFNYPE